MATNSFDSFTVKNDFAEIGFNPQGGYVTSWRVKELGDILYVGSVIKRTGIPVLFPYFGKSEKTRAHGFGRDVLWSLIEESKDRVALQLEDDDLDDATRKEYPYQFLARIVLQVGKHGELIYLLSVENMGDSALPISPGLHPYWAIDQIDKKNLVIDGISEFVAREIDWDTMPPDTVYDFPGSCTAHFPRYDLKIEDMSGVVKHLVVWSQPVSAEDHNFVCIEPVCGNHFDIDRNPILVEPGAGWKMQIKFSVLNKA